MRFHTTLTFLLSAACGAPSADRIGGDIAAVLERGIAGGSGRFDHRPWDELVQKFASDGGRRFDYAGLKHEESAFQAYLDALSQADLAALSSDEILTFFINAYNAYTVKTILDRVSEDGAYEIESILDIPDVFKREAHLVGGFELSLDNMEHNVLRPVFKDPRVHFAVNCASISCPPLPVRAFDGARVDAQLEEVTRKTLRNPDYISVEDDTLLVTKIMDWYGSDFVSKDFRGAEDTLADYIAKYATDEVREWVETQNSGAKVRFRDYDWSLNRP